MERCSGTGNWKNGREDKNTKVALTARTGSIREICDGGNVTSCDAEKTIEIFQITEKKAWGKIYLSRGGSSHFKTTAPSPVKESKEIKDKESSVLR